VIQTVPPAAVAAAAAAIEPSNAARTDAARSALQGKVSGLRDSLHRVPSMLSDMVVTGVATEKSTELLKVSSDSTPARIRTVYEVSPGVQATLTEMLTPSFMPQTLAQAAKTRERRAFDSVAARSAPQANATIAAGAAAINSIIWVDKAGHVMTLSGPLSKEQLQAMRLRLPADKR
jgi:DNA-binding transcriptional regulator YbjK